jgi:hypothetical protein
VKEDPNSVANGRFQCLVTLERFHCLVTFERFHCLVAFERFQCLVTLERFHCFVAFERFQCLVANGRRTRNTFSPLPTSPQQILLKPSFFPLILRFYFTMVLNRYFCISFLFKTTSRIIFRFNINTKSS